jgi:hypothetical protein
VDAQKAYLAALAIQQTNPTVKGLLGVIAARAGDHVNAAIYLDDAVRYNGGRTPEERDEFALALARARNEVTLLRVNISVAGAVVTIDGEPTPNVNGRTSFWLYIAPGQHEMRVEVDGYEAQEKPFEAPKGGEVPLSFDMRPIASDASVPEPAPARSPQPLERAMAVIDQRSDPTDPEWIPKRKRAVRGMVGAGPVMVLGAASWLPSFGATLSGGVRWGWASAELEARGAWLTGKIADKPIQAMTAGALLSVCAHWRWLFGCGAGHLGVIRIAAPANNYQSEAFTFVKPGLGVRFGGEIPLSESFGVRVAADVVGLPAGTRVGVARGVYADQPPLLVGANATGMWHF